VRGGARFLVNITNDGWYGVTAGPYQHARMCVLRAIENRVPIARSANSGISMFVDRTGQIVNASKLYFTDMRTETLFMGNEITFFTRHGMWLGSGCMWLSFIALAVAGGKTIIGRRRNMNLREDSAAGKV
jgi:apolipoprotein N-acyltransferase